MNYVLGFAFDENAKNLMLIRKNRPTWQAGLLNGIGGKIEHLETSYDTMVREFEEETGVKTKPECWEFVTSLMGGQGNLFQVIVHKIFLTNKQFEQAATVESEEILKFPVNDFIIDSIDGKQNSIHNVPTLIMMCLTDTKPPGHMGGY